MKSVKSIVKDTALEKGVDTQKRSSNIELLRIISMICIIAFHSILFGGSQKAELFKAPLSLNTIFVYLFGVGGYLV